MAQLRVKVKVSALTLTLDHATKMIDTKNDSLYNVCHIDTDNVDIPWL